MWKMLFMTILKAHLPVDKITNKKRRETSEGMEHTQASG